MVSEKKKSGSPSHKRTKWSPQAKWQPTKVGGRESWGTPTSEDQVDPAKMDMGWTNSIAEVGVSPTWRQGQVSGLVVDVNKSVACPESIDCCGSTWGIGCRVPFSTLTLHTCVLTSDLASKNACA